MTDLFERVLLPVADPEDAASTCQALTEYDVGSVVALHVVEKGGGAPDKASVEQRREYARDIFEVVEAILADAVTLETEIAFGTDVAETIIETAEEHEATAIVFSPRSANRWVRMLTGDVALTLVTETDRPVVVLPDSADLESDSEAAALLADDGESDETGDEGEATQPGGSGESE